MTLKVFITMPRKKYPRDHTYEMANNLRTLVKGVDILPVFGVLENGFNTCALFGEGIKRMGECDFIIFANGFEDDRHCVMEKSIADIYGIPYCTEDTIREFLCEFLCQRFSVFATEEESSDGDAGEKDAQTAVFDSDVSKAIQSVADIGCDIPQSVFVIEECSELIKELTKERRGKDNQRDIATEACDVLTSVLILLREIEVPKSDIRDLIVWKCKRAVDRFNENGKF